MRTILIFAFAILQLAFHKTGYANDEKETFTQLLQEDSADISTIASYPENVRHSVFEACTEPKGIANMNDIQKSSSEMFRQLVSSFSKDEQKKIWNLTRYKGLITKLESTGRMSKQALEETLKDYPQEIHKDAMDYTLNHFDLLKTVNGINERFNLLFEDVIKTYTPSVQAAFRELLNTPELISILNNNMHMAVHLGDIYQKSPHYLKQQFDSLSLELAQQKAKDLEEWKQKMKDNPKAESELQESAKEYAKENGYDENDYYETDPQIIYRYAYVPYPYWCGYPWWYEYEWWYPYPYWYHWGFSYWHGDIFWYSPPSWFFIHWHFHRHPHFYHYPNITNVYINYYYGYHRAEVRNPVVVHHWVKENRQVLPNDFVENKSERFERIKDFGRFSSDFQMENKYADGQIDRSDYLRKNVEKYPTLKPAVQEQLQQREDEYYREKKQPEFKPTEKYPVQKYEMPRENRFNQPEPKQPYRPPVVTPEKREYPQRTPEKQVELPKQQHVQPKPNIQPRQKLQSKQNVQPQQQMKPLPKQNTPMHQQKVVPVKPK